MPESDPRKHEKLVGFNEHRFECSSAAPSSRQRFSLMASPARTEFRDSLHLVVQLGIRLDLGLQRVGGRTAPGI